MEPETKKIIWIVVIVILVLWLLPLILGVALSPFLMSSYASGKNKDDVHIETMYNGYRSYPEGTKFYDDKGYMLSNKDLNNLKHTCHFDESHGYKTYSDGTYKVL